MKTKNPGREADNGDGPGFVFFLRVIFQLIKSKSRRINDLRKRVARLPWWEVLKNKQNPFPRSKVSVVGEMVNMSPFLGLLVLGWVSVVGCVPVAEENSKSLSTGFIGKGTNELATALLQGFVQKEENMVYSPFGYSAILAVFSEGARGASRQEIADALHFPPDVDVVRQAYRSVLERFASKTFTNSPEFKNWFYVYKNYTVEEELQNVLRKFYLTEVKTVERPEEYIKDRPTKPVKGQTKQEMEMTKADVMNEKVMEEATPMKEEVKMEPMEEMKEEVKSEMMEKTKTEIEKPVMEEVKNEKMEETMTKMEAEEDTKTKMEAEEGTKTKMETEEGTKTKMETEEGTKTKMEAEEGTKTKMEAEEGMKKPEGGAEVPMMAPIKTSAEFGVFPVEHFSGRTDSSLKIKGKEQSTRMVIFNGLYYKGEWETPFEKKPADDSRVFYKSDTEKVTTSTIHSQGVFNYGNILNLDCRAIELPYKGGRYSLLVLVPNSRNGLTKLISDLSGYSLSNIYDQLSEKLVDVCLPSFEINTISKPVTSVNKVGLSKVTSIFSPQTADLSGISTDAGLYVEELVQMVTFKVDASYSKANFLTASTASSRSNVQKFQINQPFLFYLRDNLEDIVIVNGKVIDPTPTSYLYFT